MPTLYPCVINYRCIVRETSQFLILRNEKTVGTYKSINFIFRDLSSWNSSSSTKICSSVKLSLSSKSESGLYINIDSDDGGQQSRYLMKNTWKMLTQLLTKHHLDRLSEILTLNSINQQLLCRMTSGYEHRMIGTICPSRRIWADILLKFQYRDHNELIRQ